MVVAGAALWPGSGGETEEDGASTAVSEPAGDVLEVSTVLRSYRVVYEVESFLAGARTVTTDIVSVRRPFESRIDTLGGGPPGAVRKGSVVSAFTYSGRVDDKGQSIAVSVRPVLAGGDLRFDGVLRALVDSGRLRSRDRRQVLGRECHVYRSREPITGPGVEAPTADEHTDTCIDAAGLILEDVWVVDGEVLRRRRAVEVDTDPVFDDGVFSVDTEAPAAGEQVTALEPTNRPLPTVWELGVEPAGFEHQGRYAVVLGAPPAAAVTLTDVYTSGPHVVLVEQHDQAGDPAGTDPAARSVTAGELGPATVTSSVGGTVVEARPGGTQFVRVSGTIAAAEVLALARGLRPRDGGEDFRPLPAAEREETG